MESHNIQSSQIPFQNESLALELESPLMGASGLFSTVGQDWRGSLHPYLDEFTPLQPWQEPENFLFPRDWSLSGETKSSSLIDRQSTHEILLGEGSQVGHWQGDRLLASGSQIPRQVVFIDAGVEDAEQLVSGVSANTDVFLLDSQQDGIEQISSVLNQYKNLAAVHVVSHGQNGQLQLGNSLLNLATIAQYQTLLQGWKTSIAPDGDLLLYGCNLADGADGKALMQQVSDLTGADVAASSDRTGNTALGGDWDLEVNIGDIEAGIAFNAQTQFAYQEVLVDLLNNQRITLRNGLTDLVTFGHKLDDFQNFAKSLPLINQNIGDTLDIGGFLQTELLDAFDRYVDVTPTTEEIAQFLSDETGWAVTDLSDANELEFQIQFSDDRTFLNQAIDLGYNADSLDLALNGTGQLTTTLDLNLKFGITLNNNAFFTEIDDLGARGELTANLDGTSGRIGFVEIAVGTGSNFQLEAGLDVTVNNGDRLTVAQLQQNDLTGLINFAVTPTSGINATLPVEVTLDGFNPIGTPTIQISATAAQMFSGTVNSPTFTGLAPTITVPNAFFDFTHINASELLGMLEQLNTWLTQVSGTDLLDTDIPFLENTTLGNALAFGTTFTEDFLNPLVERDLNGDILRDAAGNIQLKFDTAQALATLLTNELNGLGGAAVEASYDATTNDLTFTVNWERSFDSDPLPMDFDLELGDLANVSSSTELTLDAGVGLAFTFGIDLDPSEAVAVAPPIFQPTLPNSANGFRLNSAANFQVRILDDETGSEVGAIDVTFDGNIARSSMDDLVQALQSVINTQLVAEGFNAGDIVAEFTGDRIALTARPVTRGQPPEVVTRRLEVRATFDDPAFTELGLLSSPIPFNGRLTGTANFTLAIDGTELHIIQVAADATNNSIQDLLDDINVALSATHVSAVPVLTDAAGNPIGNRIMFQANANSGIRELSLLTVADANDPAVTQLGFPTIDPDHPNNDVTATARATNFFIDNARLTGDIAVAANDITASANFGFLGIQVTDSNGSIDASAVLDLKNPSGGSRVDLSTLIRELGRGEVDNVVDFTLTGRADLTLSAQPTIGGVSEINGVPDVIDPATIQLTIADFIAAPDTIDIQLSGLGASLFEDLGNLDFNDIVHGLNGIVNYLQSLEQPAIAAILNTEIPLLNQSLSDLMDIADRFSTFVEEVQSNPAQTVQTLDALLKDALGLPSDSDLITLSLDTQNGPALRIDFNFETSINESYAMDLSLEDLAALAGDAELLFGLSSLVGVSTTGDLSAELSALFRIALGFDLGDTVPTPFLYTGADGTKMELSANIAGQDLDFTAQIGPFGVFVEDGEAGLGGTFSVELTDDGDGRRDLSEGFNASAFDITVTGGGTLDGGAFVNLPLYFPSASTPIGGEGNNQLQFITSDLEGLLEGDLGSVSLITPDLNDILSIPSALDILRNPDILIDGLDALLLTLQDALNGTLYGISLPLIGDSLAPAGQFIEDFRDDVLSYLSFQFRRGGALNPVDLIEDALFNIFASEAQGADKLLGTFGGLGILQDLNGDGLVTPADVVVTDETDFIQFDIRLGQQVEVSQDIDFDLGLPALGLDLDAAIALTLSWELDFGFGVDVDKGFYFVSDDDSGEPELTLGLNAELTGTNSSGDANITGVLGFLAVEGTDNGTGLDLEFAVDLQDPNDDGKLTFSELVSPSTSFDEILVASATGDANVDLHLQVGFDTDFNDTGNVSPVLPSVGLDLVIHWPFLNASTESGVEFGGTPSFAFNNIELDLGSFVSDFAGPFLEEIQQILEPFDWLLDREDGLLYARLPVISDLAGETISLKTLIELLDTNAEIIPFLNTVEEIYYLVDLITDVAAEADGENLVLEFGNYDLSDLDLRDTNLQEVDVSTRTSTGTTSDINDLPSGVTRDFMQNLTSDGSGGNIDFPILEPTNILKLLLGQDVDLVTYDLPRFGFNFDYLQRFPVFPPLYVTLRGFFGADLDLELGYDTTGVSHFRESGNYLDIIDGFFINDLNDNGVDVPELTLEGGIAAGAALNLVFAEAGVEGGIEVNVDFNLNDPDQDGKVRLDELATNFMLNFDENDLTTLVTAPFAIFDIQARLEWFFRAYISILFVINEEMDLGRGTLADFPIGPFVRQPVLADRIGDVLQLNVGRNAQNRIHGDATDGNEHIAVTETADTFIVTFTDAQYGNVSQEFRKAGVSKIVAYGDNGNDQIDLSGVTSVISEIWGGAGADIISGGAQADRIDGGDGDDTLSGGSGADVIWGRRGADSLDGNAGDDSLSGDEGNDTLQGGAGNDELEGGAGADTLAGGAGDDRYRFANGWGTDNPVVDSGGADSWDFTHVTTDIIFTLKNGKINATSLGNIVENVGFEIETLQGGRGADTFDIFETGTTEILLNGQAGSDDYIVNFSDPTAGNPPPLKVVLKDTGNIWNTDVAIAYGSEQDDSLTVTDQVVTAQFPVGAPQSFAYNRFAPDSGIEALEVFALAGDDDLLVESTPETLSVIVHAGAGDDTLTVGAAETRTDVQGNTFIGTDGIQGDPLIGPLLLTGDEGRDRLIIDDAGDTSNNTGILTDEVLSGLDMAVNIEYSDLESVDITLGSGDDSFTISRTITGETELNAGAGVDTIAALSIQGATTINAGGGADGVTASLITPTSRGTFVVNGNAGNDTVNAAASTLDVIINGDQGDDTLTGGAGNDRIGGGADNDTIEGRAGEDYLRGDSRFQRNATQPVSDPPIPDETAIASQGEDVIQGGAGNDRIDGEGGNDRLIGGSTNANQLDGTDFIYGGAGDDAIAGDNATINATTLVITGLGENGADDVIFGDTGTLTPTHVAPGAPVSRAEARSAHNDGNDAIAGGVGNDTLFGGSGDDHLRGNEGADRILGDNGVITFDNGVVAQVQTTEAEVGGNDTLNGDRDNDLMLGGAGNDQMQGDDDNDILLGDNGVIDYSSDGDLTTLDHVVTRNPNQGGQDTLEGGQGNDIALGGASRDTLHGDAGHDILLGDNGEIVYTDGAIAQISTTDSDVGGQDDLRGNGGNDIILAGEDQDQAQGDDGDDILLGDNGQIRYDHDHDLTTLDRVTTLDSSIGGADTLGGNQGDDILLGGAEDDTVTGGEGNDILLGDNGDVIFTDTTVEAVTSLNVGIGGSDRLWGQAGNDVMIGGAKGDRLSGGEDNDHLVGDNAQVRYENGVLSRVETLHPEAGGQDTLAGDEGNDRVLGGAADDTLTGDEGNDILLGDNGRFIYGLNHRLHLLDLATTTDPTQGGRDTISGGNGDDVILGGTQGDILNGDRGEDHLLGDHGQFEPSQPVNRSILAIDTTTRDRGGVDTIHGGAEDDFILGQQGDDRLWGDAGEDDITGGHNVLGGADGNDDMDGGEDADVMIGDNGTIQRTLLRNGNWKRYPNPFPTVIREVQRFDDVDTIAGNDRMHGGAGDDILHGQRGHDSLFGDDQEDELFGELGNDTLRGGDGEDIMLGDVGLLVRAYERGNVPLQTQAGAWHKDVVLTDVGRILASRTLDQIPRSSDTSEILEDLLADAILVTGAYNNRGDRHLNTNGAWNTAAQIIAFLGDGRDTLWGDRGNDLLFGQRGNDRLKGGKDQDYLEGNAGNDRLEGEDDEDVLMGDDSQQLLPYTTEMPHVTHGMHLIRSRSATAEIPIHLHRFGNIIIPQMTLTPSPLDTLIPSFSIVPKAVLGLEAIAQNTLKGENKTTLAPLMAIVPDLVNHLELLSGNDQINGGGGDDTIVGDQMTQISLLQTGIESLDTRLTGLLQDLVITSDNLTDLGLKVDHYQHDLGGTTHPEDLHLGEDTVAGGAGADTIIGDDSTLVGTFATGLPNQKKPLTQREFIQSAIALNQQLADFEYVLGDITAWINHRRQEVADEIPQERPNRGNPRHNLWVGNDTIVGEEGRDRITGDGQTIFLPMVTEILDQPEQPTLFPALEGVSPSTLAAIERQIANSNKVLDRLLERHQNRHHRETNSVAYSQDFDLNTGNDRIDGGTEEDLMLGDYNTWVLPIITVNPQNATERRTLERTLDLLLQDLETYVRNLHVNEYDSPRNNRNLFNRLVAGNDQMTGGDDGDLMVGDNSTVKLPILQGSIDLSLELLEQNFDLRDQEHNFQHLLPHQYDFIRNENRTSQMGEDTLAGEEGNDIIWGLNGRDRLTAGAGMDYLFGGKETDRLNGDRGDALRTTNPSVRDENVIKPILDALLIDALSPTMRQWVQEKQATHNQFNIQGTWHVLFRG